MENQPLSREGIIRSLFDVNGRGLEIGPSYNPVVPKRDGYNVRVLDHASTADLREKYLRESNIDAGLIEKVDFVWDGRPLSEVVGGEGMYDYVVASHVIEHIPDLLGFLKECEKILSPGGKLVLAVPDQRRCFDVFRPLSTTGMVLQAHQERRRVHAPSTAFDHVAYNATLDGVAGWREGDIGALDLVHNTEFAKAVFDRSVASSEYFDFHAWTFTPSSFRLLLRDLGEITSLKLREVTFRNTPLFEFVTSLSAHGPGCELDRLSLLKRVRDELGMSGLDPSGRIISR